MRLEDLHPNIAVRGILPEVAGVPFLKRVELANGSEAHIRRAGGRIGDGVGTKFCVLTRGALSASADKR